MIIVYRAHNGYDVKAASDEAANLAGDPGVSLTVQSQAEDADINVLMHRYGITGQFPANPRVPVYGDFAGINDFQSALQAVMDAQDAFMEYPASLRARFENNPQLFLEFCSQESNRAEMEKLGLLKPAVHASVPGVGPDGQSLPATTPQPAPPIQSAPTAPTPAKTV